MEPGLSVFLVGLDLCPEPCIIAAYRCNLQQYAALKQSENMVAATHRLTVNLEAGEFRQLSALAEKYSVSLAWLGRRAIIEFLQRNEGEELQLPLNLVAERREAQR